MKILVSNDDGYHAPGIVALVKELEKEHEVVVIAPDRDRSGASNSLTLDSPIRASVTSNGFTRVDGTPTDCVHLGITGLLEEEPDMVVSGINAGANLGDDVLYSGTVAAAMEGRFLGLPAIAISMTSQQPEHFTTGAKIALQMVNKVAKNPIASDVVLNINIPDVPFEEIVSIESTRLGHRHKAEPIIPMKDPRGHTIYWVGPPGAEEDAGVGTDFYAINNNQVSVTPLHADFTRHAMLESLSDWLQ